MAHNLASRLQSVMKANNYLLPALLALIELEISSTGSGFYSYNLNFSTAPFSGLYQLTIFSVILSY